MTSGRDGSGICRSGASPLRRRGLAAVEISVIVPVFNEDRSAARWIGEHIRASTFREVIVVDASTDRATPRWLAELERVYGEELRPAGSTALVAMRTPIRGRAAQMTTGVQASSGGVLLFVHADTRLPPEAADAVREALTAGYLWGRFDVVLDAAGWPFRLIETAMNLRAALSGIATGDQGLFMRRDVFDRLGGFARIPIMEDIELCRRLKRFGRPARIRTPLVTSARRWQTEGVWRTVLRMWLLRFLYWAGVSAQRLALWYRDVR